jgi:hypothetical protein
MRIAALTAVTLFLCACAPFGDSLEAEVKDRYDAVADSPNGDRIGGRLESVECTPSGFSMEGTNMDDANTCELVFTSGERQTHCILSKGSRKMFGSYPGRCRRLPGSG